MAVRAQPRSQPWLSILLEMGSFPCFVVGPYARLAGDTRVSTSYLTVGAHDYRHTVPAGFHVGSGDSNSGPLPTESSPQLSDDLIERFYFTFH